VAGRTADIEVFKVAAKVVVAIGLSLFYRIAPLDSQLRCDSAASSNLVNPANWKRMLRVARNKLILIEL
jgi:hypothetical protein